MPIAAMACVLLQASLAFAASPSGQVPLEMRLANQVKPSEITYSHDGKHAAFSVREPGDKLPLRSSVWIFERGKESARRLFGLSGNESMPRLSPDGTRLAFVEKPEAGKARISVVGIEDQAEEASTVELGGVEDIAWLGDGSGVVALAEADDDGGLEPGMIVGSRYYKRKELRIFDPKNGSTRKLTDATWNVGKFAAVPGTRNVVVTAEDRLEPEGVVRRLFVVDGEAGAMREFGRIDGVEYDKLKVSPDGRRLAYVGSTDGPTGFDVHVQDIEGGAKANNITGPASAAIDRMVSDYGWTTGDSLVVSVQEGFGDVVYRVAMNGAKRVLRRFEDVSISAMAIGKDESFVYVMSSDVEPPEVWVHDRAGNRQISGLNGQIPGLAKGGVIAYPSWDGRIVQAKLFKPTGGSGPFPTVVLVHGGPAGRWNHRIIEWAQVLVAEGFAVVAPNIRGSSGYSQEFMTSNRADWGGGDFKDILSAVDWLVGKGISNPRKMGIAGWSYGGYMAAWAVTQTDRFKASVAGAGMIDLNLQWGGGLPDVVPYDSWYIGKPWDAPDNFVRMSPLTHVKAVKTPTMLIVGGDDRVDPAIQNWPFYRALRMNGVDSDLVIYPREGHSLLERRHAADAARRMADWMKKYLSPDPG